ncbi:MAG: ribbon-helix-helix domain-containing protein [Promethearchaeota archaeon]
MRQKSIADKLFQIVRNVFYGGQINKFFQLCKMCVCDLKKGGPSKIKIVTINIPDQYLDSIQTMVSLGFYPSRSEAVRQALKQFLVRETEFTDDMEPEKFAKLKQNQLETIISYK